MAVFASNCGLFGPNIGPDREFDAIAPRKNQQENGAMVVPRYGRTKMFPISHKSFNLWPKSYLLIGPKWQIWPNICTPFRRASCPYDRASSRLFDLLNSKWSKRSVRPKMIVWSGALFTLRWSCFRLPCFFSKMHWRFENRMYLSTSVQAIYTHLPRPACHFRTPPNPLVTFSLLLIWVSLQSKVV